MANNNLRLNIDVVADIASVTGLVNRLEEVGNAVKVRAKFEQLSSTLETVSTSSLERQKSMIWIEEFTKKTPFQLDQVSEAFIKLKNFGIDPTDGSLTTLADTASRMGKTIDQAVEAIGDALTGEFERLKEFGIKGSQTTKEVTFRYTNRMGERAEVTVEKSKEIIERTLLRIQNDRYEGARKKQSETLNGLISNFEDNFTQMQKTLVQQLGILDITKESFRSLSGGIEGFSLSSEDAIRISTNLINIFTNIRKTMEEVSLISNTLGNDFSKLSEKWDVIIKDIQNNTDWWVESAKVNFDSFVNTIEIALREASLLRRKFQADLGVIDQETYKKLEEGHKLYLFNIEKQEKQRQENLKKLRKDDISVSEKLREVEKKFNDIKKKDEQTFLNNIKEIDKTKQKLIDKTVLTNTLQKDLNNILKEEIKLDEKQSKLKRELILKTIDEVKYNEEIIKLDKEREKIFNQKISLSRQILEYEKDANLITLQDYNIKKDVLKLEEFKTTEQEKQLKLSKEKETLEKKIAKDLEEQSKKLLLNETKSIIRESKNIDKSIKLRTSKLQEYGLTESRLIDKRYNEQILLINNKLDKINELKKDKTNENNQELLKAEETLNNNILELKRNQLDEQNNLKLEKAKEANDMLSSLDYGSVASGFGINLEQEDPLRELTDFHAQRLQIMYEAGMNEKQIMEQNRKDLADIEKAKQNILLGETEKGLDGGLSLISDANKLGLIENKKARMAQQGLAIRKATINTYQAASNRLATGGPYLGPVLRARAVRQGLAQVQSIRSQRFHTGGYIDPSMGGNGGMRNDETTAILQTGEGVVSRRGMKELDRLNEGRGDKINNNDNSGEVNIAIVDSRESAEDFLQSRKGKKIIKEINS